MGFLQSIKRPLNIGGLKIELRTDDDVYSQGDRVSGTLRVGGGDYAQSVNHITVSLMEFWTETRASGGNPPTTTTVTVAESRDVCPLSGPRAFNPGDVESYAFEFQLEDNCRLSTPHTGWRFEVDIDIEGAFDKQEHVTFDVAPTEALCAVLFACEQRLRFNEVLRHRKWRVSDQKTVFRLKPPAVLRSKLDYLRLELQLDGGDVCGLLVFDMQERSIADYFRAMVGNDQLTQFIRFPAASIFCEDGSPNHDALAKTIATSLQEAIDEYHG